MASVKCNVVQREIENIISYLEPLLPLANSHMVNYFSDFLFDKCLPQDLKGEILQMGCGKALDIILQNTTVVEFTNLNRYVTNAKKLRLYNLHHVCMPRSELNKKLMEWNCTELSSPELKVFVTPKKSHEVQVLSRISSALSYYYKTTHTIDIGDGRGYLSSMLALHYKIPVLGIDASVINTDSAIKRARMLAKVWKGIAKHPTKSVAANNEKLFEPSEKLYKQTTGFVTENTNVKQLIRDVFLENGSRFSLVGLHTCGDLGATSVKIFNSDPNVKTLCNVSCCYHLLTEIFEFEDSNTNENAGFPLSTFLKNHNFKLGRSARMLAAQSIDRILHKKELPNRTVFFRSVLEVLLDRYNVTTEKRQVGKMKREFDGFAEYVCNALKNIGANISPSNQELTELFDEHKDHRDELNVFYLLRCLLAPIIESLVLLDRLLFLYENSHESAFLIQLFDPVISPRCYGLIAVKE